MRMNNMDNSTFSNSLAEFVYYRTYSRWRYDLGRRETWEESVTRLVDFYKEICPNNSISDSDFNDIYRAIVSMDVMPSMRLMWSAGDAARECSIASYNCSYLPVDSISSFAENMYLLMHGTGVGFSIEKRYVDLLPPIAESNGKKEYIVVGDSKKGWTESTYNLMNLIWEGYDIEWDLSNVRPEGTPLKTFGGRASGERPINACFKYIKNILERHRGRSLSSLNCLDLMNKIAESIVVGGVRRSAQISLSDLNDDALRHAKTGQFWNTAPFRSMSNNSAVYEHKPSAVDFMREWLALAESGSGERGIYNRSGVMKALPVRRSSEYKFGCNPCSEIVLRPREFCNLSEIVLRKGDDISTLMRKARIAAIIGTMQASLNNFQYLDELHKDWSKNVKDEALLGVSITGCMDDPDILTNTNLNSLRDYINGVNIEYSQKIGINRASATTCIKPSGTVSQLVDSASGFHPRYAKYYIRRVRISATDPLYKMMKDQGVLFYPEVGQTEKDATTWVCEFPVKAPKDAICRHDLTAIQQLEHWMKIKINYAEHTVSATIYVEDNEWMEVGNWVYSHFDQITGISFLPKSNHVYQLAPYDEIDRATYDRMKSQEVAIDYSKLAEYEYDDHTEGGQSYACVGDKCEIT